MTAPAGEAKPVPARLERRLAVAAESAQALYAGGRQTSLRRRVAGQGGRRSAAASRSGTAAAARARRNLRLPPGERRPPVLQGSDTVPCSPSTAPAGREGTGGAGCLLQVRAGAGGEVVHAILEKCSGLLHAPPAGGWHRHCVDCLACRQTRRCPLLEAALQANGLLMAAGTAPVCSTSARRCAARRGWGAQARRAVSAAAGIRPGHRAAEVHRRG